VEETGPLFNAERDEKHADEADRKKGKDGPEGRHAALVRANELVFDLGGLQVSQRVMDMHMRSRIARCGDTLHSADR
jgi:hypothetical protein